MVVVEKDCEGNDVHIKIAFSEYSKNLLIARAYRKATKKFLFWTREKYYPIIDFNSPNGSQCYSIMRVADLKDDNQEEKFIKLVVEAMKEVNNSIKSRNKHMDIKKWLDS